MSNYSTPFRTARVGGIPFKVTTLELASDWLLRVAIPSRVGVSVRLANAYNVALANSDHLYRTLLTDEGVNFPDGTPVVWSMKIQHEGKHASRVRGPSLFSMVLQESASTSTRHFFLGGSPETLALLEKAVQQRYPHAKVAGSYSPPFAKVNDDFIDDCARKIQDSDANLVWVGLGTPKQDLVSTALARKSHLVFVNVGAAFDFMAGTTQEAPGWVQRSGFEWLYRLASEPKRLWRRYLIGNAQFLYAVIKDHASTAIKGKKR